MWTDGPIDMTKLKSDLLPAIGIGSIAIEQVFKNRRLVCNMGVNSWYQKIN